MLAVIGKTGGWVSGGAVLNYREQYTIGLQYVRLRKMGGKHVYTTNTRSSNRPMVSGSGAGIDVSTHINHKQWAVAQFKRKNLPRE